MGLLIGYSNPSAIAFCESINFGNYGFLRGCQIRALKFTLFSVRMFTLPICPRIMRTVKRIHAVMVFARFTDVV